MTDASSGGDAAADATCALACQALRARFPLSMLPLCPSCVGATTPESPLEPDVDSCADTVAALPVPETPLAAALTACSQAAEVLSDASAVVETCNVSTPLVVCVRHSSTLAQYAAAPVADTAGVSPAVATPPSARGDDLVPKAGSSVIGGVDGDKIAANKHEASLPPTMSSQGPECCGMNSKVKKDIFAAPTAHGASAVVPPARQSRDSLDRSPKVRVSASARKRKGSPCGSKRTATGASGAGSAAPSEVVVLCSDDEGDDMGAPSTPQLPG